jgi:hypothetical protein
MFDKEGCCGLAPEWRDPMTWRQSDEAIRTLIAREIWRYQECPWDFDKPGGRD